jgi:hypothetical protein
MLKVLKEQAGTKRIEEVTKVGSHIEIRCKPLTFLINVTAIVSLDALHYLQRIQVNIKKSRLG